MRRKTWMLLVVAILALGADGGRTFHVVMTGEEEAPDPGDPDGSGEATFRLNPGKEQICYQLTVRDIAPATSAHIHEAPAGEPGDVVVGLEPPTDGSSSACVSVDREEILEIIQDPEAYYVNVHNDDFPGGAVRGQLSR